MAANPSWGIPSRYNAGLAISTGLANLVDLSTVSSLTALPLIGQQNSR
jgi:hypothetical protein